MFSYVERLESIERGVKSLTQPIADSFTSSFQFHRGEHRDRLLRCLRIPAWFVLDNGAIVNGQEGPSNITQSLLILSV